MPYITTNNTQLNMALRIAIGDLFGNMTQYKEGLLQEEKTCLMAGLDYNTPWTRDTAINVWNGLAFIEPEVAKNTLLSVLIKKDDHIQIGGQYWDAIIWVIGAWQYYLCTKDEEFLGLAYEASKYSMKYLEINEFSQTLGLFRGPACYGDGVAAYPDFYAKTGGSSEILQWIHYNPKHIYPVGYGLPMHALSTNCVYYQAYLVLYEMQKVLGEVADDGWLEKSERLKLAINKKFWDMDAGNYHCLVDYFGNCNHQEGMGNAFAILFHIANEEQKQILFHNTHITPAGIPCLWPTFQRYKTSDDSYGRHSGTVWPHIQGFWAEAAARNEQEDIFLDELNQLYSHICRDKQCAEIYHPITGEIYGGLQEQEERGIVLWDCCNRQTWSATALLRMVLKGLVGIELCTDGINLQPCLPGDLEYLNIHHLHYRGADLNITMEGKGHRVSELIVNDVTQDSLFIKFPWSKEINIRVKLK
jgi:glycogen debranching enzyme